MPFRIHDLPTHERPRERLLERGPNALSDRELLAIMLRTGIEGASALDLADQLLMQFGGWHGLMERTPQEIMQIKGVSEAKAIELAACFEVHRRLRAHRAESRPQITTPEDAHALYAPRFEGLRQEVFLLAMLTARNRVISDMTLFAGSLTQSVVHPREIFRIALTEAAASIYVVHNHPSGDPTPSQADLTTTHRLQDAGTLLGIPLTDHLVIAGDRWWSIKEGSGARSLPLSSKARSRVLEGRGGDKGWCATGMQ